MLFRSRLSRACRLGDGGSAESSKRDRVDARLPGFCRRLGDAGIPLTRATVILDTLHPVHEGRAFRWRADKQKTVEAVDYGRTNEGEAEENWRSSPFFYLLQFGEKAMRRPWRPAIRLIFRPQYWLGTSPAGRHRGRDRFTRVFRPCAAARPT